MKLLTTANTKTLKGMVKGYMSYILHLAPAKVSGYNVCPMAHGCAAVCLNLAGRGRFDNVQTARIRKTRQYFEQRDTFLATLVSDVKSAIKSAAKKNLTPCFRLNGTSDIRWETVPVTVGKVTYKNIMLAFPTVQFYDYTKLPNRVDLPDNYHLTFSLDEVNDNAAALAFQNGMNVAVVFRKDIPLTWNGRTVVSGDETDLRFLDATGVYVGLKAKGSGKKDATGFVRDA